MCIGMVVTHSVPRVPNLPLQPSGAAHRSCCLCPQSLCGGLSFLLGLTQGRCASAINITGCARWVAVSALCAPVTPTIAAAATPKAKQLSLCCFMSQRLKLCLQSSCGAAGRLECGAQLNDFSCCISRNR
jgi:hypothetical protein